MTQRKFTWKRQSIDARDYPFSKLVALKGFKTTGLPISVNLRYWCSAVEDQGQLGSCTANAWAGLVQYNEIRWAGMGGVNYHDMSRLFIYYNERIIEGTVNQDSGAQLRDGAQALASKGVCYETEWPYNVTQFRKKPSTQCYTAGLKNVIHSYYALNTLDDLRASIANGYPFVFGFEVYSSFMSDLVTNTGVVPMPDIATEIDEGGHAVMAMGYNDSQQRFLCKNSWGTGWGLGGNLTGYFTIPYSYVIDPTLASDYWTCIKDV